jgi:hypothetical protein
VIMLLFERVFVPIDMPFLFNKKINNTYIPIRKILETRLLLETYIL